MKRIEAFDFARALAILGMMLVNYKIVFTYGRVKSPLLTNLIEVLEGRAAAVFLILAGLGIGLMTKKAYSNQLQDQKKKNQKTLFKRAIFLFVLGMILYLAFDWSADILHYYGIYMLLVLAFVFKNPKTIVKAIFGLLAISFLLQIILDYTAGWNQDYTLYGDFFSPRGFIRHLFFNGYHPVFPWFAFILLGLVLSRIDMTEKTPGYWMAMGCGLALTLEFVSFFVIKIGSSSEVLVYLFDTKPMNPSLLYMVAASAWAVFFIGACLFIESKYGNTRIFKALSATGKMALSHYVFHAIIILGVFYALDRIAYRDEAFVVTLSLVVFIGMIVFSNLWLKYFKRGPLELVMRRLS